MSHRPVSSWTRDQLDAVEAWMKVAAPRLFVDQWVIALQPEALADGKCGTIEWLHGRHYAKLWLAGDFLDDPEPEQRETLTHELLHLRLSFITDACRNDLEELLGKPAHKAFYDPWDRQMELVVDDLARTIAPTLPAIGWPKTEEAPGADRLVVHDGDVVLTHEQPCRRCGKGLADHKVFHDQPSELTWAVEADFPGAPWKGLYCFTWSGPAGTAGAHLLGTHG